jgi:hypothetical protein
LEDFGGKMYGKPIYDPILDAYLCEACKDNNENCWPENLSFHVWRKHNLTIKEYNLRYGFDKNRRYVSQASRRLRRELAYQTGVNANIRKGVRFQEGNQFGKFERSKMTIIRLRDQGKLPKRIKYEKENSESSGN